MQCSGRSWRWTGSRLTFWPGSGRPAAAAAAVAAAAAAGPAGRGRASYDWAPSPGRAGRAAPPGSLRTGGRGGPWELPGGASSLQTACQDAGERETAEEETGHNHVGNMCVCFLINYNHKLEPLKI